MTEKPYYEIEFAVIFLDGGHIRLTPVEELTPGEALDAVKDGIFAEVAIPYHTAEAIYCFTCHIFGVPASQPAIVEMVSLQDIAPQIYLDYGHLAKEMKG
jgi:hypothetical protein